MRFAPSRFSTFDRGSLQVLRITIALMEGGKSIIPYILKVGSTVTLDILFIPYRDHPVFHTFLSLKPISQKLISSSVARMKIRINSSMRLGDTNCIWLSSSSIAKFELAKSRYVYIAASLTRSESHGFCIVLGDIVFDPFPVPVAFTEGPGVRVEALGDSTVSDETRCQCHLQCEPVF
jgi:hypothetical protein